MELKELQRLVSRAKSEPPPQKKNFNSFLVSTANKLLLVNPQEIIELLAGWFYGITWDTEQIYLTCRAGPHIFLWTGENHIKNCKMLLHQIDDAHQILWTNDILYITNTGQNRIDTWDGEQSIYQWLISSQDDIQAPDHINSIWFGDNRFYVCEHRYGKEPAIIRVFDNHFGLIDTIEFYGLANSHACGIHNVYVENDILYTLSVNNLLTKNLKTGKTKKRDIRSYKDIGYLRGLARDDNYFYVGESAVSDREDRRKGDSKVIILDNNLDIVHTILLKETGQLHDIRLLSRDKTHNGIDCPKVWDAKTKTVKAINKPRKKRTTATKAA